MHVVLALLCSVLLDIFVYISVMNSPQAIQQAAGAGYYYEINDNVIMKVVNTSFTCDGYKTCSDDMCAIAATTDFVCIKTRCHLTHGSYKLLMYLILGAVVAEAVSIMPYIVSLKACDKHSHWWAIPSAFFFVAAYALLLVFAVLHFRLDIIPFGTVSFTIKAHAMYRMFSVFWRKNNESEDEDQGEDKHLVNPVHDKYKYYDKEEVERRYAHLSRSVRKHRGDPAHVQEHIIIE